MEKGSYAQKDEQLEKEYEKCAEEGVTVTQWTNAAWRIGYRDGVKDTRIGMLEGAAAALVVVIGIEAMKVVVPKIKKFVNDKFRKK